MRSAGAPSDVFTYVIVGPEGLAWVGLHPDEAHAWSTCLGWPSDAEIAERKAAGWFCVQAQVTWQAPPKR